MPLSFWLDHFLDSRAEIHQIFALVFWKIEQHQNVILILTDLYQKNQLLLSPKFSIIFIQIDIIREIDNLLPMWFLIGSHQSKVFTFVLKFIQYWFWHQVVDIMVKILTFIHWNTWVFVGMLVAFVEAYGSVQGKILKHFSLV